MIAKGILVTSVLGLVLAAGPCFAVDPDTGYPSGDRGTTGSGTVNPGDTGAGSGSRGATDPDAMGSTRDPRERWNQYKNQQGTKPSDSPRQDAVPPEGPAGAH